MTILRQICASSRTNLQDVASVFTSYPTRAITHRSTADPTLNTGGLVRRIHPPPPPEDCICSNNPASECLSQAGICSDLFCSQKFRASRLFSSIHARRRSCARSMLGKCATFYDTTPLVTFAPVVRTGISGKKICQGQSAPPVFDQWPSIMADSFRVFPAFNLNGPSSPAVRRICARADRPFPPT